MHSWHLIPLLTALTVLQAQTPPLPATQSDGAAAQAAPTAPLFRAMVVQGSAKAINYHSLKSTTKIDLVGTVLSPLAGGWAKVENDKGVMHIVAKVWDLQAPTALGGQFMTYVLWGISPEGRATNLGEVVTKHGKCKLKVSEGMQTFGLVITAEPYFAVTQPSDAVVMENALRKDSKGTVELIDAKYEMLKRDEYRLLLGSASTPPPDGRTPLDLLQARNAVSIARAAGAPAFAGEAFGKAEVFLAQAEAPGASEKERLQSAREAVQRAEDARILTVQRQEAQRMASEKKIIQDRLEEAQRQTARAAAAEAEAQKTTARANASAAEADKTVVAARGETEQLRTELMAQLNAVLETRDTARGLIVNMNGVLFRTGKADLAPAAREKLAKIAGILAAHKGLKIEADGYTDSTGTDAFNRSLSEKRAMITKDYLVNQGVPSDAIVFKGMGKENPIASNDSDEGRKENRRVELVVTGEGVSH